MCRTLAKRGVNVYFTSHEVYDSYIGGFGINDYEKTLGECCAFGVSAYFKPFDLSIKANVRDLFDDATEKFGQIDILINCLCYHQFDSIDSIEETLFTSNVQVNCNAVFYICQEFFVRYNGNNGRVVNLSSTQSLEPLTSEISYAISKAAVPAIVYTLAPIMATKGITINAVNPGATDIGDANDRNINEYRDSNQFGRLGTPADTANLVSFLVSEEGKWITGQTINSEGAISRGLAEPNN